HGFPPPPFPTTCIILRNKLDTEQMAVIKYTLTVSARGFEVSPALEIWALFLILRAFATKDTLSVAVDESWGFPWSFTTTKIIWVLLSSISSKACVVVISPLYSPTRQEPVVLWSSSYCSQALYPESPSIAWTLVIICPDTTGTDTRMGLSSVGPDTAGALSFSSTTKT
uniref:Uncharacterized protein n=1 Tax=Anolis carolinensis TaxID=28377 RepID=A0A803SWS1_ANOCA